MIVHGEFCTIELNVLCERTKEKNIFQRVIDNQKVETIVNGLLDEQKYKGSIYQTGLIQIAINNEKWFVLDGQHRLCAYENLNSPKKIVIQTWYYENVDDMFRKFKEINSNTPIDEYVIKATVENIKKNEASNFAWIEKEKYDKVVNYVESHYARLIKKSDRPQWPNINNDHFRQIVNHIPELKDATVENIINKFEELNLRCKDKLIKGNKNEREWLNKSQNDPKLYINRYIIDLWNESRVIK